MTICVAVKVHDCLVFAADSASSLTYQQPGADPQTIVYPHGNKVFNLHRKLPICAMTCGLGNLGASSISSVAKDLRAELMGEGDYRLDVGNYTMEEVASKAQRYLFDRYKSLPVPPPTNHSMIFFVGGIGASERHPELWRIEITNGACPDPVLFHDKDATGVTWSGQPEAINRLILGYGQGLPDVLKKSGMQDDQIGALLTEISGNPEHNEASNIASPAMPVQDAIALADFLVDVSKKFVRFLPGADVVGGATDIAVVTKHEGFKWVSRKHYYSVELNPKEVDHA